MSAPCSPGNSSLAFVLDTSVAINLNATGHSQEMLKALPNEVVLVDEVYAELENGRAKGWRDADLTSKLVAEGLLTIVRLGEVGLHEFTKLVNGPAVDTLDDGEAATIAYAVETGSIALIDERKANRICAERFEVLPVASTMDIIAHREVQEALGRKVLEESVYNALSRARMRVLPEHQDWVVRLIGPQKARQCSSLPRSSLPSSPLSQPESGDGATWI